MKRGRILSAIILSIVLFTVFSTSATAVEETRNLKGFTRISFGVSGDLFVKIGPEFKVVLEGNKSYLDDIVTEVSQGRLVIKRDSWGLSFNERVTVTITMPELKSLGVSGSGKAEIVSNVKTTDLALNVSGSGRLIANELTVEKLSCNVSGSGNISCGNGEAKNAEILISGSGGYSGEELKIASADVNISGSGNCTCNVKESLKANVSGSGNVTYYGNADNVDSRVSGSGHIRSR